jgi:hypothetical protein
MMMPRFLGFWSSPSIRAPAVEEGPDRPCQMIERAWSST